MPPKPQAAQAARRPGYTPAIRRGVHAGRRRCTRRPGSSWQLMASAVRRRESSGDDTQVTRPRSRDSCCLSASRCAPKGRENPAIPSWQGCLRFATSRRRPLGGDRSARAHFGRQLAPARLVANRKFATTLSPAGRWLMATRPSTHSRCRTPRRPVMEDYGGLPPRGLAETCRLVGPRRVAASWCVGARHPGETPSPP